MVTEAGENAMARPSCGWPWRLAFSASAVLLVAATCLPQGGDAEKDFAFAEGLYAQESYKLAAEKFVRFIEQYPAHANLALALFRAGECNYRLGNFTDAARYFERLTREFPGKEETEAGWLWLGDTYYQLKRYDQAAAAYEALMQSFPRSEYLPRAAYWRAESYYRLGEFEKAIEGYKDALSRKPGEEEAAYALYSIGLSYLQLKRPGDAVTYLAQVVEKYPNSPVAAESQYLLGTAYQADKNFAAALDAFRKVLAQNPNSKFAAYAAAGIAWTHFQQGEYEKALDAFQAVADKYPESPVAAEAELRAADCLYHLGRWNDAATLYAKAADRPESPWVDEALYWCALCYEQLGHRDKAAATLNRLVRDFPQSRRTGDAQFHLGQLHLLSGDLDAAIAAFQAASDAAQDPERKQRAAAGLAWARYQKARSPEALADLEKLIRDDPRSPLAGQLAGFVGRAYFLAADYEKARDVLALIVANHPQHEQLPEALYFLGAACEKTGREEEAIQHYRRVLEQAQASSYAGPAAAGLVSLYVAKGDLAAAQQVVGALQKSGASPEAVAFCHYKLGEALAAAGKPADAAAMYEKAIAAAPESDAAAYSQVGLGWCRLSAGDLAGAAEAFRTAVVKYAGSQAATAAPAGLLAVGEKLFDQEDYPAAQVAYEQVVRDFPDSDLADEARYKLAWTLLRQGKTAEAQPLFAQAAEGTDNPAIAADARYQAARLLAEAGDFAAAAPLLEPFRTQYQDFDRRPWALALLAQAHQHAGRSEDAAAVFQLLTAAYPDHPAAAQAWLGLARVYRQAKKLDEAVEALSRVLTAGGGAASPSPTAAEAQFELAACYRDKGDLARAAEEFLKVSILYHDDRWGARAQFEAGACYEQLKDVENATKCYKAIAARYPDEREWIEKAQARLKALGQ